MRAALALICLAAPAAAQQSPAQFSLPAGCEAYLTVHMESCQVEHHYRCEGDPAGYKRDVRLDQSGITGRSLIDDEAQWIESIDGGNNARNWLEDSPNDPHSLTDLFGNGADPFDFRTHSNMRQTLRFVGQDALTGREVSIDGVTLDEVTFQISVQTEDGVELFSRSGREYVSREWRMFFSGLNQTVTPNGTFKENNRPVEFIFPGESGFLSARPKHGCGAAIS